MDSNRGEVRTRRVSARVRRRRALVALIAAVVLVGGIGVTVAAIALSQTDAAAPASADPADSPTPTPPPTPLTASQELLATTDDANACAVSFTGDGVADEPMPGPGGDLQRPPDPAARRTGVRGLLASQAVPPPSRWRTGSTGPSSSRAPTSR